MNKIIAELYDQAIVIEDGGDYVCGELDFEKFAELIVQECALVLDKNITPPSHPFNSIGYKLKQHFGVSDAT
jgi:hypothetical protein